MGNDSSMKLSHKIPINLDKVLIKTFLLQSWVWWSISRASVKPISYNICNYKHLLLWYFQVYYIVVARLAIWAFLVSRSWSWYFFSKIIWLLWYFLSKIIGFFDISSQQIIWLISYFFSKTIWLLSYFLSKILASLTFLLNK